MANVFLTPAPQRRTPTPLAPELALLIYGNHQRSAILKHPVHDTPQGYVLGPGQLLSREDHQRLVDFTAGTGLTFTAPTTLATGLHCVCWWVPPHERPLLFDAKYDAARTIARLSGVPVPHPGLVFTASRDGLHVYAVRGDQRPTPDTALCHAPYWNMFSTAQVCRGTTLYPSRFTPDTQPEWEAAFFQSVFTGPSRTDRYMNWGRSYEELLTEARAQGAFPQGVLLDAGKTLADLA
ncbi:PRTRC system protein B [Deinococcus sedimenti]|nr:PRTRC system protein B [Deinococcus sedimenti]